MNKQLKQDAVSIWRGIKTVTTIVIAVGEVIAWIILLGIASVILYRTYDGDLSMAQWQLYGLWFAVLVVAFRMSTEFVKYLKTVGQVEAGVKK